MSKKLVIPTLETQQKYPLFYAEATKTINDIIEHISKERGIYTSSIEPDPKEHLIWFNTNFNIIYFYDEKTKSFLPMTGGGGDLNTIITLIDDLRKEIGDHENWNNGYQDSSIYNALDRIDDILLNIQTSILEKIEVNDLNEIFDLNLKRGIYEVINTVSISIKQHYILVVSGNVTTPNYTLYGKTIHRSTTIDGVRQFVSFDFDNNDILEIIGSGQLGKYLEDANNLTDAINRLSGIIGELDSGDIGTDLDFMKNYSILTFLKHINELVGEGGWNLGNFPNGDNLSTCVDDLGNAVGSIEDWVNVNKDGNIIEALDRIDNTLKDIQQRLATIETIINN